MADWNLPGLTDLYTNVLTYLKNRLNDVVTMLDSTLTTPTNLPAGAKRWNSTTNKWEQWTGSAWADMADTYAISISGNAATATTATTATALSGTINESQVTNLATDLAAKAPLASPTFTGTVTAPSFSGNLSGNATSATTAASCTGNAATATSATNADTLDGYHASSLLSMSSYAAVTGKSFQTVYQASSNCLLVVLMWGTYMNNLCVKIGTTNNPTQIIAQFGDNINSNTKASSCLIPLKADTYYKIDYLDSSLLLQYPYEIINIYEYICV